MQPRRFVPIASAALVVASALAGCSPSQQAPSKPTSGPVPLADAVATLQPRSAWQHFYELTQVPRPSHHEAKATALVAAFGRQLGLPTVVDNAGNVIIREPATAGIARRPTVVLQAHLDMVPQKTSASATNFETDPIHAIVQNGWVHADGTTLGADDGIGVALIMALLEAKDVVHGPLEALFTVNEEDGFTGIEALAPDALKGRTYINVDNEVGGQLLNSSAGGVHVEARRIYHEVTTAPGSTGRQITIDGLISGYSGIDINKGRGSAHQLMARLLVKAPAELNVRLAGLVGGEVANAIPRKATAIVAVPAGQATAFANYVADFAATVARELATSDPGVKVTVSPADLPVKVMEPGAQKTLLGAVYVAPQGVYRMSNDVPGLVETSGNLGVLRIGSGRFTAGAYPRSALDSERDAEAQRYVKVFEQAGATVTVSGAFPSWPPNPNSPVLALMTQVYTDTFGTEPRVAAVHAGLETSVAGAKYPGMDMISVGPTVQNVHSPDERLEVATVPKVYELLVATLRQVK